MYQVSQAYIDAIKGRSRSVEWYGTITLTDGTVYNFNNTNIVNNAATLNRSCSSQSSIDLGGVFASELQMTLRLEEVDRYALVNAVIDLQSRLNYQDEVSTWGEVAEYSWDDLSSSTWGNPRPLYFDIPLGKFTISEVLRAVNNIKVTAYDNMLKFDLALPVVDTNPRTPFQWLRWICDACGVTLSDAMTNNYIKTLPNGSRNLTFADVNDEVSTYRDLLSELAVALASVALIDRDGTLVFRQYGMTPVDTIDSSFRYSSDFSDYQSYYTGAYASYKAKAQQEYVRNVGTLDDNGLAYNFGYNSFLQIANDSNRQAAVQNIINSQVDNVYTPFNITMPFNPAYDPADILAFTGNQATASDIAPITSISLKCNDKMNIMCGGENPKLQTAQDKASKALESLNDGSSLTGTAFVSSDFWIMIDSFPDAETTISENTLTTEVLVTTTVDNTRVQVVWTGAFTLAAAGGITVDIQVDDVSVYSVTDTQSAGAHCLTVTTGHEINSLGDHTIKVYVTGALQMAANSARLSVTGTGWSNMSFDSGDGFTVEGELWDNVATDLNYDVGEDVDWDLIATDYPMDWTDVIYTDPDGIVYTDPDGDGIWTDPLTGLEYPGGGDIWVPENMLLDISDSLADIALSDASLAGYSIPDDILPTLYGGPVSTEINPIYFDSDRPHLYNPPCYYLQMAARNAQLFLGEPFIHTDATGGNITVYDDAFTTRDGSTKAIYYSGCTTNMTFETVPSPYNSYPVSYVAWQCIYGSLNRTLIGTSENTVSSEDITNGASGMDNMSYNGSTYYKS